MKTSTLELGGAKLAYTDSTDGPTVVLIHAFPLDREMWQPQVAGLAGKARLLALDLPGFGGSSPAAFTVDTAADLVADFLTAVGVPGRAVVGGLSMGGYVAMAFARRHADRLAGLILADTRSEADDETGRQNRDKLIALAKEQGPAAVFEQLLPKVLCEETRAGRPEVVTAVRALAARQSTEGVVNALAALRDRPNATPGLSNVAAPTLILVGEHDEITPPAVAAALGARIWGSHVITIPAAGHLSNVENPHAFNAAVLEFLATVHQA